jgi:hypothetical protein
MSPADLANSHTQLRAALIFAGRRIRQLQFGRRNDDPVLRKLRQILREAREVATSHNLRGRQKPPADVPPK